MAKQAVVGLFVVLFSLPFVAAGFGMTAIHVQNSMRASDVVESARPVDATVLSTSIEKHRTCEGGRCGGDDQAFAVHVTYEYTVDGTRYESSRMLPPTEPGTGREFDDRPGAERFLANYSVNDTVTAYYLPDDPDTSFLVKHLRHDSLGEMLLSTGAFLGFGFVGLLFGSFGAWLAYSDLRG